MKDKSTIILFANDTALVIISEEECQLVEEFGRVCRRRNLRESKSKIMKCNIGGWW